MFMCFLGESVDNVSRIYLFVWSVVLKNLESTHAVSRSKSEKEGESWRVHMLFRDRNLKKEGE